MLFVDWCTKNKITLKDGLYLFSKNNAITNKNTDLPYIGEDLYRFYNWDRNLDKDPIKITIDEKLQIELERRLKSVQPHIKSLLFNRFLKYGGEYHLNNIPRKLKEYLGKTDCFCGKFQHASQNKNKPLMHLCLENVKFAKDFEKDDILADHLWITISNEKFDGLLNEGLINRTSWILFYGTIKSYIKDNPQNMRKFIDYKIDCKDVKVIN